MSKGLVFSSPAPNDQGGIIPNEVIDLSRYRLNPVLLLEHRWTAEFLIGTTGNWRMENGEWVCDPEFHLETQVSKENAGMYNKGALRAASIGGEAIWKMNSTGTEYERDADGNRICEKFYLYEISLVALPSNPEAVAKNAAPRCYEKHELAALTSSLTTLSTKFHRHTMDTTIDTVELTPEELQAAKEAKKTRLAAEKAAKEQADKEALAAAGADKKGSVLDFIKGLVGLGGNISINAGTPAMPNQSDAADTSQPSKDLVPDQPKPIGLSAKEKAQKELDAAKEKAEKATEKVKKAKEKAEKENASDEDMEDYKSCMKEAEAAMKECEAAEKKVKEAEDKKDDEEPETNAAGKGKHITIASAKPMKKTTEELKADLEGQRIKLAATPTEREQARVKADYTGKTITQLLSSKDTNDQNIINRALYADPASKDIAAYKALLGAVMADGKFAAVTEKARFHMNIAEGMAKSWAGNPDARTGGVTPAHLAAQLNRGFVRGFGTDNVMRDVTTLGSSANLLASPDLFAIEWLTLFIFQLYASSAWKTKVPTLAATVTGKNLGVVWAASSGSPTIYRGAQPSNPTNSINTDVPVAMSLTPYFLQPRIFTPWTMHQVRYDQMTTSWASDFAFMNQYIDDNLLYTLANIVPAASIITASGLSGYQTAAQTVNIAPNTPNSFYFNSGFAGSLMAPVLNDIIGIEQVYRNQNFDLETLEAVLVCDPIQEAALARDPEAKNFLTRWIADNGKELLKFKHTIIETRSRVAAYDPVSGQMKDPEGSIPSTTVSSGLGFIPSQVAIGLGMLDVFMVQSPSNYGYVMSADVREGINALRPGVQGLTAFTYKAANV